MQNAWKRRVISKALMTPDKSDIVFWITDLPLQTQMQSVHFHSNIVVEAHGKRKRERSYVMYVSMICAVMWRGHFNKQASEQVYFEWLTWISVDLWLFKILLSLIAIIIMIDFHILDIREIFLTFISALSDSKTKLLFIRRIQYVMSLCK